MNEIEKLTLSLGCLSRVRPGDRICTGGGGIVVDRSYIPSIVRRCYGESRRGNIQYVSKTIHLLVELAEILVDSKTIDQPKLDLIRGIVRTFKASLVGIDALLETYADDSTASVDLQGIRRLLEERVGVLSDFIKTQAE
jgi:hypothetical protein